MRRTIESVVAQTCRDFEYIVIDGGSTDSSVEVIKEYDQSIDYWVSERDRGIYHAMNKGVAQAHGDYCIFMNSGDCFYGSDVLECVRGEFAADDFVVGKAVSQKDNTALFAPPVRDISLYYFYTGTLPHQSSFIKTDLLRQFPYDESLKIVSDWKFFVQTIILHDCSVKFIDEIVAKFDVDGVSTSNPHATWEEKMNVLTELFPSKVLKDCQYLKDSECLTQQLTPKLRINYGVDRILFNLGRFLLKIKR